MADVKFLFKREGRVKVALKEMGDDVEAHSEELVEVAFSAGAEDFEYEDLPEGGRTVEVSPNSAQVCACRVLIGP